MPKNLNLKNRQLHELFAIAHGNKLDLNKMQQCAPGDDAVAFIGRSGEDNGIVAFVEELKDLPPYDKGLITVALGGAALSSFVQPRRFYTAQNIDVLTPLTKMSLDRKMYYCLCIEANRFRYSTYGREANRTLRNLLVPDTDFVPQWVDGATTGAVKELAKDLEAVLRL